MPVPGSLTLSVLTLLPVLLVLVGIAASFVLGANDVSNATGALIMTNLSSLILAGFMGALTWGKRILHTVAFDVVKGEKMLYIALLRGINVGGHTVKMERLRELFTELGFTNVRTYIQSGNVFFETEQIERETVAQMIEQHLHKALSYEVPVFLRTIPELERIVASNAFQHLNVTPDMRLCVVFTSEKIPDTLALPLRSPKNDMEIVHTTDHEAFIVWYLINGRPPAGAGFKVLGDRTTTRFFHTTAKILLAAKEGAKSKTPE